MTHASSLLSIVDTTRCSVQRDLLDPRAEMFARLPRAMQPFLTWLTAKPAPGEPIRKRSPRRFVATAGLLLLAGVLISGAALSSAGPWPWVLLPLGWLLTASALGSCQVVIFHHCAHGTVFAGRSTNETVGRLISAVLLFKHFDLYRHDHMLHHSPKKLLTEDDEFADFVFGVCGLRAGERKSRLWCRVLANLVSPVFHARFLVRRVKAALLSHDRRHNLVGIAVWGTLIVAAAATQHLALLLAAWVLPVTVLLQIATVFRILCEHRFPDVGTIRNRDRNFAAHATSGVFPGVVPPAQSMRSPAGLLRWLGWWAAMLFWQLPVRLFVLVGDAPCHDFHHRRPASRRWTSYIQERQHDLEADTPGFAAGYSDTWGLLRAVDANLASLARLPAGYRPLAESA